MKTDAHLTSLFPSQLEQQIRTTHPGQAHWAGKGPFATTCGDCRYLAYFQQDRNASGDIIATRFKGGCAVFYRLTGKQTWPVHIKRKRAQVRAAYALRFKTASAVRLVVLARVLVVCSSNLLIPLACVHVSSQDHDGGGR